MAIMKALQLGVPFVAITSALTTAVNGTPFAMPFKTTPLLNILAVPTGSVSAFSYDVQASVDGITYVTIAAAVTTQPLLTALKDSCSYPIIRINQVSRTGGTTNAIVVTSVSVMIKALNIQVPFNTTVILVNEPKAVKVIFEYADNIFIGGQPNLNDINDRVSVARIITSSAELIIPKNEILYGWQNAKKDFDSCKMLLISSD